MPPCFQTANPLRRWAEKRRGNVTSRTSRYGRRKCSADPTVGHPFMSSFKPLEFHVLATQVLFICVPSCLQTAARCDFGSPKRAQNATFMYVTLDMPTKDALGIGQEVIFLCLVSTKCTSNTHVRAVLFRVHPCLQTTNPLRP